jgi:hypothetical protein
MAHGALPALTEVRVLVQQYLNPEVQFAIAASGLDVAAATAVTGKISMGWTSAMRQEQQQLAG